MEFVKEVNRGVHYPIPTGNNNDSWWAAFWVLVFGVLMGVSCCSCSRTSYSDELTVRDWEYAVLMDSVERVNERLRETESTLNRMDSVYVEVRDCVVVQTINDTVYKEKYIYSKVYERQTEREKLLMQVIDSLRLFGRYEKMMDSGSQEIQYITETKEVKYIPWYVKVFGVIGVCTLLGLLTWMFVRIKSSFFS